MQTWPADWPSRLDEPTRQVWAHTKPEKEEEEKRGEKKKPPTHERSGRRLYKVGAGTGGSSVVDRHVTISLTLPNANPLFLVLFSLIGFC